MPEFYNFDGNWVTFLGAIGIISTGIILNTSFRRFYKSDLNR